MKNLLALSVSLLIFISTGYSAPDESYGKIELIRDEWGIPHVFSETDPGAYYGLGYATAEDRGFQMTFSLRSIQGRTAEVLGDIKMRKSTAVEFDKKMRIMGFYHAAKELVPNLEQETVKLLEAYCQGVNDYFEQNQDQLLYLFDELNMEHEPWTPADCIASWWGFGKFFAIEGLHDTLVYNRLQDETQQLRSGPTVSDNEAAVIKREDVSSEWIDALNRYAKENGLIESDTTSGEGPKFSHAWVVGGEKSTTGSAVLCSDPQTPVRNPSLLYEFHMKGKTFNARGIGVSGSPIILIGFNEHLAWGATALGADQADQFFLKTDGDHPNQYQFDGEWLDMEIREETIKVKDGRDIPITLKWTRFGPVVTEIAHGMKRGMQVALKRIPICETEHETIEASLPMMQAKDVHEFDKALDGWRFPSANILCGDKDGNIGYWALAAIPIRSKHALNHGSATHDGSSSKYDWQGILPYEYLPHVINPKRGYLHSGNHRPIEAFYPIPIGISTGSQGDSPRSWRLRERLQAKDQFTPDEVLDIHFDMVNAPKRELLRLGYHLRDTLNESLPSDTLHTLEYLEEWYNNGAQIDLRSQGTELALVMPTIFRFRSERNPLRQKYGGGNSGLCHFLKTTQKRLQDDPQAELDEAEKQYVIQSLGQAWQTALKRYGRNQETWHEKAKEQLLQKTLGYQSTLNGFDSFDSEHDVNYPPLRCTDGSTIFSQEAQSYSQWVPLDDVDKAKTIIPIGISEKPGNPYRLSQYGAWATGAMHPAPLSRESVEIYQKEAEILAN